jgi:D-methionine transport system substrate-binding protein
MSLKSVLRGAVFAAAGFAVVSTAAYAKAIKVGVIQGPDEQIVEFIKSEMAKKNVEIEVVAFSDYVLPNRAVADGDLDLNAFQHQPYLDKQINDRGYKLVTVGTSVVMPMGVYSDKVKSLKDLPEGASIGVPNDPTNGGRALLLMQEAGLIKVDPAAKLTPSVVDVLENPKNLKFVELDAAQLVRAIPDVDAAAINTNYAMEAGMVPAKDALVIEGLSSPYVNIIVAHEDNKDKPWVKTFVDAYQSAPTAAFIAKTFKGGIVPAFEVK